MKPFFQKNYSKIKNVVKQKTMLFHIETHVGFQKPQSCWYSMFGNSSGKVSLRTALCMGGSMFIRIWAPKYSEQFSMRGFPNPRIVLPEHFEFALTLFSCYFTNYTGCPKKSTKFVHRCVSWTKVNKVK